MKKDIEWLKEVVSEILLTSKKDGTNYFYYRDLKGKIYNAIDQLDEPEVLSQEFIDKHAEYYEYIGHAVVPVDELQNLIVPKQEELESRIKVLIEAYRQEEGAYGERENGWISGFIKDLKNLVEEEQKYYVLVRDEEYGGFWFLSKKNNGNISIGINRNYSEIDWDALKLTEQEIKDYDERFWAFAVLKGECQ